MFEVCGLLIVAFLLPLCFSPTITFAVEANISGNDGVCGVVQTLQNKTVTLRLGESLSREEFENIHIKKLKDAVFIPKTENNCVIKICGYSWTNEPIMDSNLLIQTRNYADCQIVKKDDQSEISPNIYNDSFNVTSISCGCQNKLSDTSNRSCNQTCQTKHKEIDWEENQCAILYEEKNCRECWFKPIILQNGESFRRDHSRFIRSVMIKDQCTVKHTRPSLSGISDKGSRVTFYNPPIIDITDRELYKRDYSTFFCACKDESQISTTAVKPTTQTPFTTETTTAQPMDQSCALITLSDFTSQHIHLFANRVIDRDDYENVRSGKLQDAIFSVGTNFIPPEKCILKICGLSKLAGPPYDTGTCEPYFGGNATIIPAPPGIYKADYQVASLSCSCGTEETSNCTRGCYMINATFIWKPNECAVMFQEGGCHNCYYEPVILHEHEEFLTLNSYQFLSMIVRSGCVVKKLWMFPNDNIPREQEFQYLVIRVDPNFHRYSANFTCSCTPDEDNGTNGTTTSTSTIKTTSVTDITSSLAPTTTGEPEVPDGQNCAYIMVKTAPISQKVNLYQNNASNPAEFKKIRVGKLKNALFAPGTSRTDPKRCVLEICGFSTTAKAPYRYGTCEKYSGDPIIASFDIYRDDYEVSSASCSCRSSNTGNCVSKTCLSQNATKIWQIDECAELYEETNCQSCYYRPRSLFLETSFNSLNFYQIKSLVVRPGCRVEKHTSGALWLDKPYIFEYDGVRNNITPVYHKDSENFTCSCLPGIGGSDSDSTSESSIQNALNITAAVVFTVGLSALAVIAFALIKRNLTKIPKCQNHHKKSESESTLVTVITRSRQTTDGDGDMSSVPTDYFSDIDPDPRESDHPAAINSNSEDDQPSTSSSKNDIILPIGEASSKPSSLEEKSIETQLKSEIMEEVKKMMESFFGSTGHDGFSSSNSMQSFQRSQSSSPEPEGTEGRESEFAALLARFQEICSPQHIIERNLFSIPLKYLECPLGDGMSGTVYKGVFNTDDFDGFYQTIAVKKIKWQCSKQNVVQSFLREVQTFESIGNGSQFIVQFLGACCHNDGLYVLTTLCELGSLKNYLMKEMKPRILLTDINNLPLKCVGNDYYLVDERKEMELMKKIRLSEQDLLQLLLWCEQTASGMEYLSMKGIIHVDLAVRNLLLSAGKIIKICDFGLSRKCKYKDDCAKTYLTDDFPFNSFAPEYINKKIDEPRQVSLYVDIWSFGCCVWEIFMLGASLYPDVKEKGFLKCFEIGKKLQKGYRHPNPPLAPYYVCEVLDKCWAEVPQSRPKFAELKKLFQGWRMQLEESDI